MRAVRDWILPIVVAVAATFVAFLAGLFLVAVASLNHLLPAEGLAKVFTVAVLSHGLASFTGVVAGTAVARSGKRQVASVLAMLMVLYQFIGQAAMSATAGPSTPDFMMRLPYSIAWLLATAAALLLVRQRHADVGKRTAP